MVANLGFVNPSAQAIVIEVNINSIDKITKITTYVNGIPTYTKLEGLKFSVAGIAQEFPDLKGKPIPQMKKIALERFKEHLQQFDSEKELIDYIKKELGRSGYVLQTIQKPGFRTQRAKHGKHS